VRQRLNFSPQPFASLRGAAAAPWLLSAVLLAALAVSLIYWFGLRRSNHEAHQRIEALKSQQRESEDQRDRLIREMRDLDVRDYMKQVQEFHGIQTAYGAHWGRLLDDLSAALPDDVRIVSLRPADSAAAARNARLQLSAEARVKQAQLDFIRGLQAQPVFGEVRLERESYGQGGLAVAFDLTLAYRPEGG